jgi:ketosteroid isomerase-like protein
MTTSSLPQRRLPFLFSLAAFAFCATFAQAALADDAADVLNLVRQHVAAQTRFDVPALAALTADNYVEVSPLGEVDTREKMLAFYAPEKKTATPVITVEEPLVRVSGGTAVLIGKLAISVNAGGQQRQMAMRASYVAIKEGANWKLMSAQYTGIAPKRPAQPQ